MASIRPKTPALIRSSSSTPSGSRAQMRSALYLTSGRYCSTSWLRSSTVGSVSVVAPELLDVHVHVRHHGFLPDEGKRRRSAGAGPAAAVRPPWCLERPYRAAAVAAAPSAEGTGRERLFPGPPPARHSPMPGPAPSVARSLGLQFRLPQTRLPGPRRNRVPASCNGRGPSPRGGACEENHSLRCYRPPLREP